MALQQVCIVARGGQNTIEPGQPVTLQLLRGSRESQVAPGQRSTFGRSHAAMPRRFDIVNIQDHALGAGTHLIQIGSAPKLLDECGFVPPARHTALDLSFEAGEAIHQWRPIADQSRSVAQDARERTPGMKRQRRLRPPGPTRPGGLRVGGIRMLPAQGRRWRERKNAAPGIRARRWREWALLRWLDRAPPPPGTTPWAYFRNRTYFSNRAHFRNRWMACSYTDLVSLAVLVQENSPALARALSRSPRISSTLLHGRSQCIQP